MHRKEDFHSAPTPHPRPGSRMDPGRLLGFAHLHRGDAGHGGHRLRTW